MVVIPVIRFVNTANGMRTTSIIRTINILNISVRTNMVSHSMYAIDIMDILSIPLTRKRLEKT